MTTDMTAAISRHLEVLCGQIGARPGGTPANRAARSWTWSCSRWPSRIGAPCVPVCTLAELECAELSGSIALLYGALSQQPLAAKSWFLSSENDLRAFRHQIRYPRRGR